MSGEGPPLKMPSLGPRGRQRALQGLGPRPVVQMDSLHLLCATHRPLGADGACWLLLAAPALGRSVAARTPTPVWRLRRVHRRTNRLISPWKTRCQGHFRVLASSGPCRSATLTLRRAGLRIRPVKLAHRKTWETPCRRMGPCALPAHQCSPVLEKCAVVSHSQCWCWLVPLCSRLSLCKARLICWARTLLWSLLCLFACAVHAVRGNVRLKWPSL